MTGIVVHLTPGAAAGASPEPDVDYEDRRQAEARPKMDRGNGWAQCFAAGVVEEPAGRDEESAEHQHAYAGETIFPRAPGAAYVQRKEDAENNEHQHRGGAVQAKRPRRGRMSRRAEFCFCSSPLLENPPE